MVHLFVIALLPYVFLPSLQNIVCPLVWQMTPNPSAALSEHVSLVHMKSYVTLVLTSEVNLTLFSFPS